MSQRQCEHDANQYADSNDKGQCVARVRVVVGEQEIGLDIVVECHVAENGGNKVEEKAGSDRGRGNLFHLFRATTENKVSINVEEVFSLPFQLGKNWQDGGVTNKTERHCRHCIDRLKLVFTRMQ